ncbi:DNA polymerase IV [Clostridiaceae bacterium HSG29]|nr:DNA polymerase IV [Clostridiaceae bacterium HSG29]
MQNKKIFFLIDVNSAFLSWEATYRLQHGSKIDLRNIPSIVGGDPKTRHGIVLAKSIPAKKYNITTGESLRDALIKCPTLTIIKPSYMIYLQASNAMINLVKEYSPKIQRFSIDECFVDYTDSQKIFGDPIKVANEIKERIKNELGFTVNIGISNNKLLAKMASDLKKPDMVHTLFKDELKEKFWPLSVEKLFMVGRKTLPKLNRIGIFTIGDLANSNLELIQYYLKSHGKLIWEYANGIENSQIMLNKYENIKSIGNSTTIPYDIENVEIALLHLLSLTEMVSMRLRDKKKLCSLISVTIKNNEFISYSHQRKLYYLTDSTNEIFNEVKKLFINSWKNEPIRHLGISVSSLKNNDEKQLSIWDNKNNEKLRKLDQTIDELRYKYGNQIIQRTSFLHSGIKNVNGGIEKDYPTMNSIL